MPRPSPEQYFSTYLETYETSTSPPSTVLRSSRNYLRSYSSVTTPNFPHQRPWNPFSSYKQFGSREASINMYEFFPGRPDLGWGKYKVGFIGSGFNCPTLDSVNFSVDCLNMASNRHMDAIADRKVNLAQALAERNQTVRLITDTARRLANSLKYLKRGNLPMAGRALGWSKGPRDSSGSLSRDWLALQFGWKPLLSDVYGAAELLAQRHYTRSPRIVVKTTTRQTLSRKDWGTLFSNTVPCPLQGVEKHLVRYESVYTVSNQFIRDGGQTGILDPLTVAWELLPWSFVIDWFIPIGDFVRRLNYDSGLSFVSGLRTQFSSFEGVAKPQASTSIPWSGGRTLVRECSGQFLSAAYRVHRVIMSSPLKARPPAFRDPFSPTRCLTALSLLRVQYR